MKKAIILGIIVSLLSGCGAVKDKGTVSSVSSATSVTTVESQSADTSVMSVHTTYGGYGIAGQKLSEGSFDNEYEVFEGDVIYEGFDGCYYIERELSDDSPFAGDLQDYKAFQIVDITVDSVVIVNVLGDTSECSFDTKIPFNSVITVADGVNFQHTITFTRKV